MPLDYTARRRGMPRSRDLGRPERGTAHGGAGSRIVVTGGGGSGHRSTVSDLERCRPTRATARGPGGYARHHVRTSSCANTGSGRPHRRRVEAVPCPNRGDGLVLRVTGHHTDQHHGEQQRWQRGAGHRSAIGPAGHRDLGDRQQAVRSRPARAEQGSGQRRHHRRQHGRRAADQLLHRGRGERLEQHRRRDRHLHPCGQRPADDEPDEDRRLPARPADREDHPGLR